MKENLRQLNRTKFLEDKTDCLKDSIIQLYHIYLDPLNVNSEILPWLPTLSIFHTFMNTLPILLSSKARDVLAAAPAECKENNALLAKFDDRDLISVFW